MNFMKKVFYFCHQNIITMRVLSFLSLLLICISADAYDFMSDGIYYNIISEEARTVEVTNDGHYLVSNQTYIGDVVIPEKVINNGKTYTVTVIGEWAFSYCEDLKSIQLPNTVKIIKRCAFSICNSLKSIKIPNSVEIIENNAFSDCENLLSVYIPSSVTTIGEGAFSWCENLLSVVIPSSVNNLASSAFLNCRGLMEIVVDNDNITYASVDGVLYNKDISVLIYSPTAKQTVDVPNTVNSIMANAFFCCMQLESVHLGNSITYIGDRAFDNCHNLEQINIPESVKSIGESAFWACGLKTVKIPASVSYIGRCAFAGCDNLLSITVDKNNQKFSSIEGLLYDKSISTLLCCPAGRSEVSVSNKITSIGESAFEGCNKLSSITIPSKVTTIGDWALSSCENIKELNCNPTEPPYYKTEDRSIDENVLKTAILYIPKGSKGVYEKVDPWRNFWNIKETGN